jgi:hypothetical protein
MALVSGPMFFSNICILKPFDHEIALTSDKTNMHSISHDIQQR